MGVEARGQQVKNLGTLGLSLHIGNIWGDSPGDPNGRGGRLWHQDFSNNPPPPLPSGDPLAVRRKGCSPRELYACLRGWPAFPSPPAPGGFS